ncbi:MAG: hypothetical protein AABX65_00475 [Nanoarchaeota archaeon]
MKKGGVGEKRNKIMLISVLLGVLVISAVWIFSGNNDKATTEKECESDRDCVKQRTTCCPCSMGGKEACMSKKNASVFENKLKECGSGLICPALYACQPEKKCGCVEGKCQ